MAVSWRRPELIVYLALLSRCFGKQLSDELRKRNTTGSGQFLRCFFYRNGQNYVCLFCFKPAEWTSWHTPLLRTHGVLATLFFWALTFLFILECVFITHTILPMKKVKTNLTIDPKVKRNGERLAKKGGLSLSAFITTLLVKELAKENKR